MKDKNLELMANAPISKAVITLAIPTVVNSLISVVYNLTDTFFIGLLDDPIQLGAISLAFPIFLVIQAISTIFSVGAPSYISRCLGAQEYEKVKKTSSVAFYGVTIIMLALTALFFLFEGPILTVMGTTAENIAATKAYTDVIALFSFTIGIQIVLPCLLRAEGKVKEAAIGMMIGAITNILLDPVFIFVFRMGATGAAWATIIGNVAAVIYCITVIKKGNTYTSISLHDFRPTKKIVLEIVQIGVPSSITNFVMSFANIMLNNFASNYGNSAVSAVGVSGKMMSIITMVIGGYVIGYLPLAGYNYGAGNIKRLQKAFWFTAISSTVFGIILMIPFALLGPAFMRAFTSDKEIIELGVHCLYIYVFCLPVLGMQYTVTSTCQAVGKALSAMISNLGRQGIFYIPALILFDKIWGFFGLMYAQVVADYLAVILAILLALPLIRWLSRKEI